MKQVKLIFAIAFILMTSITTVIAGDNVETNFQVPVKLEYLGNIKNQPLLQLTFDGSKMENEFLISISDEFGFELYSGKVKGEFFLKKFLLNTEELGDITLKFKVTSFKTGHSTEFKVTSQRTFTNQLDVVKL